MVRWWGKNWIAELKKRISKIHFGWSPLWLKWCMETRLKWIFSSHNKLGLPWLKTGFGYESMSSITKKSSKAKTNRFLSNGLDGCGDQCHYFHTRGRSISCEEGCILGEYTITNWNSIFWTRKSVSKMIFGLLMGRRWKDDLSFC